MVSKHLYPPSRSLSVLIALTACVMLSACGLNAMRTSQQSTEASSSLTSQTPTQLVARLQQAKALDEDGLNDPTISVERRGDFLEHEAKADSLIRDLQHGISVPQDELNYALEVPPRHIQPEQKAELIQQLKNAIREDERREQGVVAFSSNVFYEDPDAPSQFGGQEQLALKEMQNLEAGNHVSWDALQQALYVPPDPL